MASKNLDTIPVKVFFRDGSHLTIKLGVLANFGDLHKSVVTRVRGLKGSKTIRDSDPLMLYFSLYTVTTDAYIERLVSPNETVWSIVSQFKLASDHIEFARLIYRSPAIHPIQLHTSPIFTSLSGNILGSSSNSAQLNQRDSPKARVSSSQSDDEGSRSHQSISTTTTSSTGNLSSPNTRAKSPPNLPPLRNSNSGKSSPSLLSTSSKRKSEADSTWTSTSTQGPLMTVPSTEISSSESPGTSPAPSPRQAQSIPSTNTIDASSPIRKRRGSISGSSSSTINKSNDTSQSSSNLQSSSQNSFTHSSNNTLNHTIPQIQTKIDPTELWADFLENTHLIATCSLYRPKDPFEPIQLAALHFYILTLQSPPTESSKSNRKEAEKAEKTEKKSNSSSPSVQLQSPSYESKAHRKLLHKNMPAFLPSRLVSLTHLKPSVIEDSVWTTYLEHAKQQLSITDAMQEYAKILMNWKYYGVRLFFEVKREASLINLSSRSQILALNEDGIVVLKKEGDIIATYPYILLTYWNASGNTLTLEYLTEEASSIGSTALPGQSSSNSSSSFINETSLNSSSGSIINPVGSTIDVSSNTSNQNSSTKFFANSGQTSTVTFITPQAETISYIMQVYLDRLVENVFKRADSLRDQPSPRIVLTSISMPDYIVNQHSSDQSNSNNSLNPSNQYTQLLQSNDSISAKETLSDTDSNSSRSTTSEILPQGGYASSSSRSSLSSSKQKNYQYYSNNTSNNNANRKHFQDSGASSGTSDSDKDAPNPLLINSDLLSPQPLSHSSVMHSYGNSATSGNLIGANASNPSSGKRAGSSPASPASRARSPSMGYRNPPSSDPITNRSDFMSSIDENGPTLTNEDGPRRQNKPRRSNSPSVHK